MKTPPIKTLLNLDAEKSAFGSIIKVIDGHPLYDFGVEYSGIGVEWPGGHCVYLLLGDDGWKYVGQTRFLCSRIQQHRQDKTFNRVLALALRETVSFSGAPADLVKAKNFETHYIQQLEPIYNRTMRGKIEKYTPPRYIHAA